MTDVMTDTPRIHFRRNARRITARRCPDGSIRITAPYGLDPERQKRIIEALVARLNAEEPAECPILFNIGPETAFDGISFRFAACRRGQHRLKATIDRRRQPFQVCIYIPADLDLRNPAVQKRISDLMIKIARRRWDALVLKTAIDTSRRLGVSPSKWNIGRGRRTLGTCHSDKSITLSAVLAFLPHELKEFVICHELAHLTEMNHSSRFHRLCDEYVGGREKELSERLKAYRWPIIR